MYEQSFRLRGKTYDYKVQYDSIKKFMLLPKPDDLHVLIVIGLDPPLRQGQTRYPFLVMQFKKDDELELDLNMTEYVLGVLGALGLVRASVATICADLGVGQRTAQRTIQRQAAGALRSAHQCRRRSDLSCPLGKEGGHAVQGLFEVCPPLRLGSPSDPITASFTSPVPLHEHGHVVKRATG